MRQERKIKKMTKENIEQELQVVQIGNGKVLSVTIGREMVWGKQKPRKCSDLMVRDNKRCMSICDAMIGGHTVVWEKGKPSKGSYSRVKKKNYMYEHELS